MRLIDRFRGGTGEVRHTPTLSMDDYLLFQSQQYGFGGGGVQFSNPGDPQPAVEHSFVGYANQLFRASAPVFALEQIRVDVFSSIRFMYQRLEQGRPSVMWSDATLDILNDPPHGDTVQDLLMLQLLTADLAGTCYHARSGDELVWLRPDWIGVVFAERPDGLGVRKAGYLYWEGGKESGSKPVVLMPDDVATFIPKPDPLNPWRGMSWLTPVLREVQADSAARDHKLKFFENGATVNLAVTLKETVSPEEFAEFKEKMEASHKGTANAYKTLYLGGGADVTVVGSDLKQIDFKATQGHGEPLSLDTPVPTPTGWTNMGAIKPGDEVFGRDGRVINVVDVLPVHLGRDCYRVTFNDSTSIVADAGHLWSAIDRNTARRLDQVFTTEQIAAGIGEWAARGNGGNRYGVAPPKAVKLPERDLLVDPYVLGCWLGDGQTAGAAICGAHEDLKYIAAEVDRRGYRVSWWGRQPGRVPVIGLPGGVLHALDAIGVLGDKHIPEEYMRSSVEQRLDLLRGLMDTDGSVATRTGRTTGQCEFSSKWEHLARQAAELARSLGYRVYVGRRESVRSQTGEHWRVGFRADPGMVPFLLPRKAEQCSKPVKVVNRAIVSVEHVESVPVRCIAVDSDDHLFLVGEGWIPTHNTRLAAAAGVPAVVVGFSEGMQGSSLNAGNYSQARRRFADGTLHPLWMNSAGSFANVIPVPPSNRLTYDARDVPFLSEDARDAAEIERIKAGSIRTLVDGGFEWESTIDAVTGEDLTLLKHTGKLSVQLTDPTDETDPAADPPDPTPTEV